MTRHELAVLSQAANDPWFFSSFAKVVHPILGVVPFILYPFQRAVLYDFVFKQFNIVLKARQMGLTEMLCLYGLWLAMYHPHKNIVVISLKDRVAKKFLKRVKHIYMNLPAILRTPVVNGRRGEYGTSSEMHFSNGSSITSLPTTEDAGRSEAVSLLIMDEAAIMALADTIWTAAFPTLATGGSAIINSCVTGDTEIIGKDGVIRIDTICPTEFGKQDVSHLGLKVLTHTGKWQRILGAVNKGVLETWEVKDTQGNTLKCTPAHKLYTTRGWKSVKEIIKESLNIITYDTGVRELEELPITTPPEKEIIKEIKGYPKYRISNMGTVYMQQRGDWVEKEARPTGRQNAQGKDYLTITLWANGKKKKFSIHKLVAQHFIGEIPKGYLVNHINNNPEVNHVNNLEIVTVAENTQKASAYSYGMLIGGKVGKGFANIELIARIKEFYDNDGGSRGYQQRIRDMVREEFGKEVQGSYITRILDGTRVSNVEVSKLTLVRKYLDNIYDISVEGDQSYIDTNSFISHNTPYGVGNFYYNTWTDGIYGINGFNNIRLTWDMHPDRELDWYEKMRNVLGSKRTAQEIDGDFLASGDTVFDLADIKAIEEDLLERPAIERRLNGNLLIFEKPDPNEEYFIGVDVATGRATDYSAFTVMNRAGKEFAAFKGRVPTNRLRDLAMGVGRDYNNALLAIEGNDIGEGVVQGAQERGYPNLYYTEQFVKEKRASKPTTRKVPGWYTTSANRSIIIDGLEEDIREETITVSDPFFVNEAYTFIYDASNRAVAMQKGESISGSDETYSDDSIIAKCITNHIRKGKRLSSSTTIPPR